MPIRRATAPDVDDYIEDFEPEDSEEVDEQPVRPRRTVKKAPLAPAVDEDDEEERPARVKRPARRVVEPEEVDDEDSLSTEDVIGSGWEAAQELQQRNDDFATDLKLSSDPTLVKFVDDAPFAVYRQHFINELPKGRKKSYICLASRSGNIEDCPLCYDLGYRADKKFAFNVVDLSGDEPVLKVLTAGQRLEQTLKSANDGKYGPLNKAYWELARQGEGRQTTYTITPVRERDLEEDYGVDPAELMAQIRKLGRFDASILQKPTRKELRALVEELDS